MKPETHILENLDIIAVLNISCENLRMQNKLTNLDKISFSGNSEKNV